MLRAGHEDPGMRRRNYHYACHHLAATFREWRRTRPTHREPVPNSTLSTPPMGEMDDDAIDHWARRISAADAEVSINQTNEALARTKVRAGEAL